LLDIEEYINHRVKSLSGAFKRILSIALTILGKSDLIILDEPTANLDTHSRSIVWAAIQKIRPGRTIVLAT
jgi:ABC-type multidrug transport system ATPase subunit